MSPFIDKTRPPLFASDFPLKREALYTEASVRVCHDFGLRSASSSPDLQGSPVTTVWGQSSNFHLSPLSFIFPRSHADHFSTVTTPD